MKTLFLSKKGETENWPLSDIFFYILYVILLGGAAIFFVFIITLQVSSLMKPPLGIEQTVLLDRIFSPACFGTTPISISSGFYNVDPSKFTQQQLSQCLPNLKSGDIAFRLKLSDSQNSIFLTLTTSNWNPLNYLDPKVTPIKKPVNILNQGKISSGVITVETQNYR